MFDTISSREAARRLEIHHNTLSNWVRTGKIKPRRLARTGAPVYTERCLALIRQWAVAGTEPLDLLNAPLTAEEKAARELEQRKATAAHWASLPPWDDNERARRQRLGLPTNDIGDKERRLADLEAKMPGIFGENNFPDPID